MPDGSITSTRDKSEEPAHFCLHVINVLQQNMRPNSGMFVYSPPVVSVNEAAPVNPQPSSSYAAPSPVAASTSNGAGASAPSAAAAAAASAGAWSKEQEAAAYEQNNRQQEQQQQPSAPSDTPPNYTNLFPQLPK